MKKTFPIIALAGVLACGAAIANPEPTFDFVNHAEKFNDHGVVFQTSCGQHDLASVSDTKTTNSMAPCSGMQMQVSADESQFVDCKFGKLPWVYSGEGHVTFVADDNKGEGPLECRAIHGAYTE